jgi:MFS family permease
MTPILAAGFTSVAETYDVSKQQVALTTGLYMLGLGIGSVIMSPTAILFGKRPVYLLGAILFILSAAWCALSPNYASLVVARVFQGIAVSPVECLPSATIAEIYFLHERAYRVGIYTLLLLGGKNLVPLASAAVIESLGWRWVFWIVAIIVGGFFFLLFFLVPETFWDRTPRPRPRRSHKRPHAHRTVSDLVHHGFHRGRQSHLQLPDEVTGPKENIEDRPSRKNKNTHVGFADDEADNEKQHPEASSDATRTAPAEDAVDTAPVTPAVERSDGFLRPPLAVISPPSHSDMEAARHDALSPARSESHSPGALTGSMHYTNRLRDRPKISYIQQLKVWNGRIAHDSWLKIAVRPFILFAYPSVLWSTAVYSLSVGWLIVLSECVSVIYETSEYYGFTPLQTGLIYISPFVGGLLGTAVAGKVSDILVKFMTRRNGGIYEPEFRLVMAIPIALSTVIGLMGFGWSAQLMNAWIVPTIFFGMISFGCCLGSTTAITFCVDSYRQYAGEALVTLNFSKSMSFPTSSPSRTYLTRNPDILHGLVFSLFIVDWLESDGSRTVFLAIGGIQIFFLLLTIPMYIYGKRARMWTVRKRLMERF